MTDTDTFKALCAEAKDLMKRLEGSTVSKVTVELDDAKIEVERGLAPVVAAPGAPPPPVLSGPISASMGISPGARGASGSFAALGAIVDNRIPVLAPLVGTFYEASTPGAKPFVEVGQTVEAGETVCIVEAMKLMNEIEAEAAGKIVEIMVKNGEHVEYGQALFRLSLV